MPGVMLFVSLVVARWLGQAHASSLQHAAAGGGLTSIHSRSAPMPRKLLRLEDAAHGAPSMPSRDSGGHDTRNATTAPPAPVPVAGPGVGMQVPSSDGAGSHTLVVILLPVVAVLSILAFMAWALRRGLRQQPRNTQLSGNSQLLVRPVSLVNLEAELTSTDSNLDSSTGPSSSDSDSSGNPRRVLRVRSLRDVAQGWQQQLQRKSSSIWRTPAPARGLQQLRRLSIGSASAASGALRLVRSSMERARANTLFAQRAAMLRPAESTPTEAAPAATAVAAAATSADEEGLNYARLAPVIPALQQRYHQVCQELTKLEQEAGSDGQSARSAEEQAAFEQLLLLKQRLQGQLLEVVQQLQGRALGTWEEEKLARDIWETLDTAAAVSSALPGRPKRFPGLAPWLIAELPTWVHTPAPPAPLPAAAAAAGRQEGAAGCGSAAAASCATPQGGASDAANGSPATPRGALPVTSTELSGPPSWVQDCEAGPCCAVCLDPLEAGDLLQRLPPCAHTFHAPCLASWLAHSATCPVCRTVVLPMAKESSETHC